MHRPRAPWSSPLWSGVEMCGWRASVRSYWWAGGRGEAVSSAHCTWQTHTHSYLSVPQKRGRQTDKQKAYLSRHNSKDMKPHLKPRRQVRSECDHTQNKPPLNLDGFFHLSHMHNIDIKTTDLQPAWSHNQWAEGSSTAAFSKNSPKLLLSVVVYAISSKQLLYTSCLPFCWCAEHQTIDNSVSEQWPQRAKGVGGCRTAVLEGKPQNTCTVIQTLLFSQVLILTGMEQRYNKKHWKAEKQYRMMETLVANLLDSRWLLYGALPSHWAPQMLLSKKI